MLPLTATRQAEPRRVPGKPRTSRHALRVYERPLGSWKVFAVVDIEYERCTLRLLPVRFISLVLFSSQRSLSPPSLAHIKGRSLLPKRRTRISSSYRHKFLSTALLDSRPPRPHLLSPVREKGDKVFGERLARLLAASSRTIRSPTTTSPTSMTSSTTWQARTPTPSPALLLLLCRKCSPFC